MANRKGLHKQLDQVFNTQSLISGLQSQLDTDSALRADLSSDLEEIDAGSNGHLELLLAIAGELEDEINELLTNLSVAQSALEVYNIAGCTSQSGSIDMSEATTVFLRLLPNHREWDAKLNQQFKRLNSMKRSLTH